mgnify:CR=1 FL=1
MNTVRTFFKNADVKKIGVVSFYAIFCNQHSDEGIFL